MYAEKCAVLCAPLAAFDEKSLAWTFLVVVVAGASDDTPPAALAPGAVGTPSVISVTPLYSYRHESGFQNQTTSPGRRENDDDGEDDEASSERATTTRAAEQRISDRGLQLIRSCVFVALKRAHA